MKIIRGSVWRLMLVCVAMAGGTLAGCEHKTAPRKLAPKARLEVFAVAPANSPGSRAAVDPQSGSTIHLIMPPVLTSADIATVRRADDSPAAQSLMVNLTNVGARKLTAATTPATGQRLAIVVNEQVVAVPAVMAPLSDSFQIAGGAIERDGEQIFRALTE